MTQQLPGRQATLANGAAVPLTRAAAALGQLNSHLHSQDTEWDVVYHLRELSLGRPLEPEQTRVLVREGLLDADGTLDPVVQAVVLSAVRGEGRALHLSSPFTEANDRAVAEFLNARDHILSHLPKEEAADLMTDQIEEHIRRARGGQGAGSGDPPHLRELFRRLGLPDRPAPDSDDTPGGTTR